MLYQVIGNPNTSWFRVSALGFRVQGLGSRIQGLGSGVRAQR